MNMAATIDAPAKCELRSVIRFLQAEGRSAAVYAAGDNNNKGSLL